MIFFMMLLLTASTFAYEELNCFLRNNFTIELSEDWKLNIFGAELKVIFARDTLEILTYPRKEEVNFVIKETIIKFKGNIAENFHDYNLIINQTFYTRALGSATLKSSPSSSWLEDFQLFLPKNSTNRETLSEQIESEIYQFATRCMDINLNIKLGKLQSRDFSNYLSPFEFGLLSIKSQYPSTICSKNSLQERTVKKKPSISQSTINAIVDAALIEGIEKLKKIDSLRIETPNATITYLNGWFGPIGRLFATNGYISNFTTFKRTNKISLQRNENKFIAIGGFGLVDPVFKYDFMIKHFITLFGKATLRINKLAFDGKIVIIYGQNSCNTSLEYLFLSEIGEQAFDIELLGSASSTVSHITNYIVKKWKSISIDIVTEIAKDMVTSYITQFNCSKYRPVDI